jgi:hypothetical protein
MQPEPTPLPQSTLTQDCVLPGSNAPTRERQIRALTLPVRRHQTPGVEEADRIWNRVLERSYTPRLAGDKALARALRFHSSAMSGGVLETVYRTSAADLDAAQSSYRWLGLGAVAEIIDRVRRAIDDGSLEEDDRTDELEESADSEYNSLIPTDAALETTFRRRLAQKPDAFDST